MAEKVKVCNINKEKGYLYYLDKNGNVSRSKMARGKEKGGGAEVVEETNIQREKGYLYFIDKEGDVSRAKMARGGKKQ
ncbi:MAG: hypothetical protein K9M80_05830 [Candidatus Marinimicrobia bacterium]|nr:hypothetical protein [Candidatus Neomarinimicrobiota bacterium]